VETLAVRIFRRIHTAADSEVAAVCLVILGGLAAVTAVGVWLLGAGAHSGGFQPPNSREQDALATPPGV
jgi:hypothetical protein